MNQNSGTFKCPKCGNNKIGEFKNWINREEFIDNKINKKWIFYVEKKKKWKCCIACGKDMRYSCKRNLLCCCRKDTVDGCCIFLPCSSIFYILFWFWIDLFYYLCCLTYKYIGVAGKTSMPKIENDKIWNIDGLTEDEWNSKYNKKWECSNCKYCDKSFLAFIPNSNNGNEIPKKRTEIQLRLIENINIPSSMESNEEIIAIHFESNNQDIKYTTTCKKSDKFNNVIKKLLEEYPEYKKKEIFFLSNGERIEENKTISENKIKTGDKILINIL